ncbi:hypothetical protein NL676_003599 [Syzygium grande]|nr:hypothetical protein NL676_003599 [Syzygium grande]
MGNPTLDGETELKGRALYYWSHGLISDDTYQGLSSTLCSSLKTYRLKACEPYFITYLLEEAGNVNGFNVLRTECKKKRSKAIQQSYSLPAKEKSMLPTLELLKRSGLQIWIYSGDADSMIPFTATRTAISKLHLKRKAKWYPWGHNGKISVWSEIYEGITFATIRGCGHEVPMYAPAQALKVFEHFLANESLPKYTE